MLPLEILKGAKNKTILVQIKNGDSIHGTLEKIDTFMNLKINNVIYTNKDGSKIYNGKEIFIRGNNISAINFENTLLNDINKEKEEALHQKAENSNNNKVNNNISSNANNDKQFLNRKRFDSSNRGRGGPHNSMRGRGRGIKRGK